MATLLGLGTVVGLGVAFITLRAVHARDAAQCRAVRTSLAAPAEVAPPLYDPAMVASLPPVAQRYFARAIAPGTPLCRRVELQMEGTFILNGNPFAMQARQILAPPDRGLVWQARIGKGLMRFAGSDGYHAPPDGPVSSWTKFWVAETIPIARAGGTKNHARAAATRVMLESLWAPASLLPQYGATWVETGPDSAEIRFAGLTGIEPMQIRLDANGDPVEVWALRWSDANPDRVWRLQPFGGHLLETGPFGGFRVPVRVELGNLFGTPGYAPFYLATITRVDHL